MTDAEIIKALECCSTGIFVCDTEACPLKDSVPDTIAACRFELVILALDLINRLQADKKALIAGQGTLQKALAEKNEEFENQSQNFKVLVSDHRCLQQSFDHLKGLYEAEKARGEMAKKKCIGFAKELQTAKAELKETTEKFNCQQYVYADLSNIIREKNAEIERLQVDNSSMQSTLAEKAAEVERLKNDCFCISNERDAIGDCLNEAVEEAKAEAIKELLNKIEKQAIPNEDDVYWVELDDIYNSVKEMVGETE